MSKEKNQQNKGNPKPKSTFETALPDAIAESLTYHTNVQEKVVTITESKIKICLMECLDNMRERGSWKTPVGIAGTIIITLITTDFKDALNLTKEVWEAIFIIGCILSVIWSAVEILKQPKKMTVETILTQLIPTTEVVIAVKGKVK